MMINTAGPPAEQAKQPAAEGGVEKDENDYEQEALNFLSLAL